VAKYRRQLQEAAKRQRRELVRDIFRRAFAPKKTSPRHRAKAGK